VERHHDPDWLRVIADGLSRDDPRVPSATFLWIGAEWLEREAYDMFGIIFEGNRDLRRIFMPPDYTSFPLRKDFSCPTTRPARPGGGRPPHRADPSPPPWPPRSRPASAGPRRAEDEMPTRPPAPGRRLPPPTAPTPPSTARRQNPEAAVRRHAPYPSDDPRVMLDRQIGLFEPIPPYPTRTEREAEFYTLGDGEMFLNVGPQHPATHGVLRLVLKLSGEQVVDVDPVLGYLHRGVEKICENSDYYHVIDQVDPLEYVSSLFQEWAAVMAFEKLMDVQVPRRAEYIRVLSGELLRIASHACTWASWRSTWAA
jgi:hypothetical protein